MKHDRVTNAAFLFLRLAAGFLFFQSGAIGLLGWFGKAPGSPAIPPALDTQMGIGLAMEIVGGVLIFFGLLTRLVAFLLCGEMAVAYWQFHAPHAQWPALNQGLPAVLFSFIFLLIAANGAGILSVDALFARSRKSTEERKPLRLAIHM